MTLFTSQNIRIGNFLCAIACIGMVAFAVIYLQKMQWIQPCDLCILQRIMFIIIGLFFLLAAIQHPTGIGRKIYASLISLSALIGGGIAVKHLYTLWYPVQIDAGGCVPGMKSYVSYLGIDKLKEVLTATGSCGTPDYFLGVILPAWTLMGFIAFAVVGLILNCKKVAK